MEASEPLYDVLKDVGFGSIAGMASKFFEHPFDLTKVRLQAQVLEEKRRFKGPVDCLIQTWQKEGVRGLYRGLPAPIVGAMAENATLFVTYSEVKRLIRFLYPEGAHEPLSLPQLTVAGFAAGAVTSFVLTPVELVKCKMQVQMLVTPSVLAPGVQTSAKLPGPISVLMNIIRETGLRGLYLGHTGTFIREAGGGAAWFAAKEFTSTLLRRYRPGDKPSAKPRDLLPWESAVSGACAGASYNIAFFPADTVKSTMQTEDELRPRGKGVPKPTFTATFRALYKAHGVTGLYQGMGVTIARSIPSSAIIFLIYDTLSQRFK